MIADGHPAHRCRKLKSWLEQRKSQIELVTLPGYAPELNPDEMLNQDLKRGVFKTRRPYTQGEMISQTRTFLRATQKQVERVRSYLREAHVAYAGLQQTSKYSLSASIEDQSELLSSDNSPLRGSSRQLCESEGCDVFSMGAFSRSCLATWQLEAQNK